MNRYRVMFVCSGNICRSPLAHAVFENLVEKEGLEDRVFIESSGTGPWHVGEQADTRMRRTARKHGVQLDHRSRQLRTKDLAEYDLVLAMDRHNEREILRLCRDDACRNRVRLFREYDPDGTGEVPDPWYGGQEGFDEVWRIVERTSRALLDVVKREIAA